MEGSGGRRHGGLNSILLRSDITNAGLVGYFWSIKNLILVPLTNVACENT